MICSVYSRFAVDLHVHSQSTGLVTALAKMLRFRHRMRKRNLPKAEGWGSGPLGRITKMRKLVTALVRHERIEGKQPWLDEARGYAERVGFSSPFSV